MGNDSIANLHDFLADLMRAQSDQYRREQQQVDALRSPQPFTESLARPKENDHEAA